MKFYWLLLTTSICVYIAACQPVTINSNKPAEDTLTNKMVTVNKYLINKDIEAIKGYASRRKWDLHQTESGLFFQIYKQVAGKKADNKQIATIKYSCELLDGTVCYSSNTNGYKEITLGAGKAEAGLEEGILLLRKGESARLILLPHLAFGLMGDENKIPPRSTIVYDIELINLVEGKN